MSEILSGARYTLGALVVLTLWTIGAAKFYEYRIESVMSDVADAQEARESAMADANDKFMMEHGYPLDASNEDIRRHHIRAQETPL